MICKKCGKEIDNDSLFCEFCGEKNKSISKNGKPKTNALSKQKKNIFKAIIVLTVLIVLLAGYFIYIPYWYSANYYGIADYAIEEMNYNGEQFIDNIEIDKKNHSLKLNFSENNFDSAIGDSLQIKSICYRFGQNYCVYDYNIEEYCFEYVDPVAGQIESIEENTFNYSEYIIDNFNFDYCKFEEGKVYKFNLEFGLALNDKSANLLSRLFIKTYENPYIGAYIYRYHNIFLAHKLESFSTNSYFVYENGCLKPLLSNVNLDKYVNAVWDDTNLNLIKYDEYGNMYLEGPVRTRENIPLK